MSTPAVQGTAEEIESLRVKRQRHTQAASLEEGSIAASNPAMIGPLESPTEEQLARAVAYAAHNRDTWAKWEALGIEHPVGRVAWVHIDRVQANDWNPNAVAQSEMNLLHTSIAEDGYTMPLVTIWDPETGNTPDTPGRFVIVDGFHRYTTMKRFPDIYETTGGFLPIVVLHKSVADRMASTVRHNRARGAHSVAGMSNLVFDMLREGESDTTIIEKLGLEPEELVRLKHITGYSKLFKDHQYSKQPMTEAQMRAKAEYKKENPDAVIPQW